MRLLVAALVLAAVAPAAAHHPFTPYYDASKPVSLTGTVVEFRATNPHVELTVDGTVSDGRSGRWVIEGSSPNALERQGVKSLRDRLLPGTRVTISGWPAKDPAARAFSGRELTFADGAKVLFGPTPEEGDRWSCGSPCTYKVPSPAK